VDRKSLRRILARDDVMTYGLFVGEEMCAYALLKLFFTKRAYIGRLVAPRLTGIGVGKFLSRYLCWQGNLLRFCPCSSIHHDNLASLKSHAAVRPYNVVAELPNGFRLIRFGTIPEDDNPPTLDIKSKKPKS